MQDEYEKQLEAAVRRELDGLGDLTAPPGLAERVMRKIELEAASTPWYRHAWPAWPLALRIAWVFVLVAALGAICFGMVQVAQTGLFASVSHSIGEVVNRVDVVGRTFDVVANSIRLALGSLSPLHLALLMIVGGVCYAVCVGVGTIYYRLAFVRR